MKINNKIINDLWNFNEFTKEIEKKYIATSDDPCGEMNIADKMLVYSYAAQLWFSEKANEKR